MRESVKILMCALASLGLCMGMHAMVTDSSPSQYLSIADRNLFRLKPVPPQEPIHAAPPALPTIVLNGITDILGRKLAIMKVSFPAKPGEPAREQSYMLAEGQRDGDIEVLEVNEKAGTVKVNNSGTVMMLTFEPTTPALPKIVLRSFTTEVGKKLANMKALSPAGPGAPLAPQ